MDFPEFTSPAPSQPDTIDDDSFTAVIRMLEIPCDACGAGPGEACTTRPGIGELDLPVPVHDVRGRASAYANNGVLATARRRTNLAPATTTVTDAPLGAADPCAAAVIAAAVPCHRCFALVWPHMNAAEDAAFRTWMRQAAADLAWNEPVARLTSDETAWHDQFHDAHIVPEPRGQRPREHALTIDAVQRCLDLTAWQTSAALALALLPPWLFTQGAWRWPAALIDEACRDRVLARVGERRPLAYWSAVDALQARLGPQSYPVRLEPLVEAGHLRQVGWSHGSPTFLAHDLAALPIEVVRQAVCAPAEPVPDLGWAVHVEEADPFPPDHFEPHWRR